MPRKWCFWIFLPRFFSKNAKMSSEHNWFSSFPFSKANPSGWGPHTGLPAILSKGVGLGPGLGITQLLHSHSLPFPTQNRYGAQVQPNSAPLGGWLPQTLPRPLQGLSEAPLSSTAHPDAPGLLASFPLQQQPSQIGFLDTVFKVDRLSETQASIFRRRNGYSPPCRTGSLIWTFIYTAKGQR